MKIKEFIKGLKNTVTIQKAILGGLLVLPVLALFLLDRFILLFLIWKQSPTIREFFQSLFFIEMAVYRVSTFIVLIVIYYLIF